MNVPKTYIRESLVSKSLLFHSDVKKIEKFLKSGFIKKSTNPGTYQINTLSDIFIDAVIAVAEEDLQIDFPSNILDCIVFISNYESWLKNSFSDNNYNAFEFLIEPFKIWSLVKLHKENKDNLIVFYKAHNENESSTNHELWRFEEYFFKALFYLNIKTEEIWQVLTSANKKDQEQTINHQKSEFALKLADVNYDQALQLYQYGKKNNLNNDAVLLALLLAGLYNNGYKKAVNEAKAIFESNQEIAIVFWGAINNRSSRSIDYIIGIWCKVDKENIETVNQYIFTLQKLLTPPISENQADQIFQIYFELLNLQNESITNGVSRILCWFIHDYEKQRYDLLRAALNQKLVNGNFINDYFQNFKSPRYFFDFFAITYSKLKSKTKVDLFENGFCHFVNSTYEQTEKEILELLCDENFHLRTGIIKLWINSRQRRQLNLLLLDSEVKQLRAIEALVAFPFGINKIMPSLLILRNSPFENVKKFLQYSLGILIFDAYQQYAVQLIENSLDNTNEDKQFMKPLRQYLTEFEKVQEVKNAIKDLNPRANEKHYLQLYYKLEGEQHAKSVNDIDKDEGSLLFQLGGKSVNIVRGNAWKIEEREVAALGKFETSISVDSRMFKNPDQFEINLNFPITKF